MDTVTTTSTSTTSSTAPPETPTTDEAPPPIGRLTPPIEPRETTTHYVASPAYLRDPPDTPPFNNNYEADVDRPPPSHGNCTACSEYTEDLQICRDCQLPFDYHCILSTHNRITHEADYQCIDCHRKQSIHPTQDDLSEPSADESDESSTIQDSPQGSRGDEHSHDHTGDSPPASINFHDNQAPPATTTFQSKPLRPKSAASARTISTRKSPQRTRHYLKSSDPNPDDDHE